MSSAEWAGLPRAFILPSGWVTRISTADTLTDLQTVTNELASRIGFTQVAYSMNDMSRPRSVPAVPAVFFTTYPSEWIDRYVARQYGLVDPVVRAAMRGRAFRWSEIPDHALQHEQRHFLHEANEFGLRDGFCVPALGGRMMGTLNAVPGGSDAERAAIMRYGTESLTALGLVVHERACVLVQREARDQLDSLSPDELEMLRRVTAGASLDTAAEALGLSEAEALERIESLMARLNVQSLPHLRARGVVLGLAPA